MDWIHVAQLLEDFCEEKQYSAGSPECGKLHD